MNTRQFIDDYLAAISAMKTGEDLAAFFHADVEQIEYPNRLVPDGATRDLAQILEGAERGTMVLESQSYDVQSFVAAEDAVCFEAEWRGKLKVPVGSLAAGDAMVAHFAVFIELRDGLIWRQRNYDCFRPF